MIELKDISLSYADEVAVDHVDIVFHPLEITAILGSSGSGKTSLISMIDALKTPSTGSIYINSVRVDEPRLETAVIFQNYGILPWKTVYENIAFTLRIRKIKNYDSIVQEVLELLNISEYAHRFPHQLSGGQMQRVAIARALALDVDVLLMDEAFSALDSLTKETLQDLLLEIRAKRNLTILFVTHNIEEAVFLGNRIVIMEKGKIKEDIQNSSVGNRASTHFYEMCQKVRGYLHD